eukprot:5287678-Amphidinium_carterae.2
MDGLESQGCSSYSILPPAPNWQQIRQTLIETVFGKYGMPTRATPDDMTTFLANHTFLPCTCFLTGKCKRADCVKMINITRLQQDVAKQKNPTPHNSRSSMCISTKCLSVRMLVG